MKRNILLPLILLLLFFSGIDVFAFTTTGSKTDITCNGKANGTMTAIINPLDAGTPNYSYTLYKLVTAIYKPVDSLTNTALTTYVFDSLGPGKYFILVQDSDLNVDITNNETIIEPNVVGINESLIMNISCMSGSDGLIDINHTGGTAGGWTYIWSNSKTTEDISFLTVGTYTVTVADINTCTAKKSYTLTSPSSMTISSVKTNVLCKGSSTGVIDITVAGGTPGYTYLWTGGTITQDKSSLAAGTYTVTVTDANTCTSTHSTTLTEPSALTLTRAVTHVKCFGTSTGAIDLTVAGGTPNYSYLWTGGTATQDRASLAIGTYTVTVTDNNLCTAITSATVTQPNTMTLTKAETHVLCNGVSTGKIDLTVAGGATNYTYLWTGGAVTQDVNNLAAGTYTVTVTDANACTAKTSSTITQIAAMTLTRVVTNVLCNGTNNGIIDLSVNGGTANYTYLWSNAKTTQDVSSLTAATYTVTVTDANVCTAQTSVAITEPSAMTISVVGVVHVLCNGRNTGSINISLFGGSTPYSYNWSHGAGTQDAVNLTAGTYTVTVTDARACTATNSTTITQPNAITLTTARTHVLCNGASTGIIDLTVTGGVTNYTYLWSNAKATQDISSLSANTYTVTVTDANACTAATSAVITESTALTISSVVTDVLCKSANNGIIDLTVAGGKTNYTYLWSNAKVTQDISNLSPNTYTVTVTDANACTARISSTITEPSAITITLSGITHVFCNGSNTGAIDITPAGGSIPYGYSWTGGAVTEDINGLVVGTYTVTVTDARACTAKTSATITQPTTMTLTTAITHVLCNGASTGILDLSVAGGVANYSYNWSNLAATQDISSLAAASYTVTVTDAYLCTATKSATVTQPNAITLTTARTHVLCNGSSTGVIDLTVAGGKTNYTYLWSNTKVTQDISSLSAATYTVTVTDANACTAATSTTITEIAGMTLTPVVTDVLCNGANNGIIDLSVAGGTANYTYLWTAGGAVTQDVSSLAPNTYTVTVTDANACTAKTSTVITQPTVITVTVAGVTHVLCNGSSTGAIDITPAGGTSPYNYSWTGGSITQDRNGLVIGTYTLTVTDARLCTATTSATITQPTAMTLTTAITHVLCNGASTGVIDLTVTGGVTNYSYNWSNFAATQDISSLAATTYTVTVTDANLCTATKSAIITELSAMTLTTAETAVSCSAGNDGEIALSVAGGTTNYTYLWVGGATTKDINNLVGGTYTVTVTDANACTATTSTTITEISPMTLTTVVTHVTCNGGGDGQIDLTVTGGTPIFTYVWSNNPTTQDINGLAIGTYTVTVTDANTCTVETSVLITQPVVLAGGTIDSDQNICYNGDPAILTSTVDPVGGSGAYTYDWEYQDNCAGGWNSVGQNSSTYDPPALTATRCYRRVTTDVCGVVNSNIVTITVATQVLPVITANKNEECENATISLDGNPAGGTTGIWQTHSWTGAGAGTLTPTDNQTPDFSSGSDGTYTLIYTVTDIDGCTGTDDISVTINDNPSPTISPDPASGCLSSQISMNGNPAGGTGVWTTHSWTGAAASSLSASTIVNPVFSNGVINTYTLTYTVTDSKGCTGSDDVIITINGYPTAVISPDPANACFGDDLNMDGSPAGGSAVFVAHEWSGADALLLSATNVQTPVFSGGLAGSTYNLTYQVTDSDGCTGSDDIEITVYGNPTVAIDPVQVVVCDGAIGTVNGNPAGGNAPYNHVWTGNGAGGLSSTSVQIPTYTATPAGQYTLIYTVTDSKGCTASDNIGATVNNNPIPVISPDPAEVCENIDLSLNGNPAGGTGIYLVHGWGGTGAASLILTDVVNPVFNNNTAGTYILTYIVVDNNSCSGTDDITVTVNDNPAIAISPDPAAMCETIATQMDANTAGGTGAYTHSWVGTGEPFLSSSAIVNPVFQSVGVGTFYLTYTATDTKGCIGTDDIVVSVNSNLTINLASDSTCVGITTALDGSPSGGLTPYTHAWTGTGGTYLSESTIVNPDFTPTIGGVVYTLTYSATDNNGCTGSDQMEMTVNVNPTAVISNNPLNICFGKDINMDGNPVGGSGTWTNHAWTGAGSSLLLSTDIQNPVFSSTAPVGQHNLIYTVLDSKGCIGSDDIEVTVNKNPTVTISPNPAEVCELSSLNINGNTADGDAPIIVRLWGGTGVPFLSDNSSTPVFNNLGTAAVGLYTLNYTAFDNIGCAGSDEITITVFKNPVSKILPDPVTTCMGSGVTIDGNPSNGVTPYSHAWTDPNASLNSIGIQQPLFANAIAGTYNLTYTVTDAKGCTGSDDIGVVQLDSVGISSALVTNVLCNGIANGAIDITATGGSSTYSYQWGTSDGSGVVIADEDQSALSKGNYYVTVSDDENCKVIKSYSLTEPNLMTFGSTVISEIDNYFIADNGAINLTVTGGTPVFTYSWNNSATTEDISGLTGGNYSVTVTDGNFCQKDTSFFIADTSKFLAHISYSRNILCFGDSDGMAVVSLTTDTTGVQYTWHIRSTNTVIGSNNDTITGLLAGDYYVKAEETTGLNRIDTAYFTLTQPAAALSLSVSGTNSLKCFGDIDGNVDLKVSGGIASYKYLWSTSETTEDLLDKSAGIYTVTVTDANTCTATTSHTILQPNKLSISVVIDNECAAGLGDGGISIEAFGGTLPYNFKWSDGNTNKDLIGIGADVYYITVTDVNNCYEVDTFTVDAGTFMNAGDIEGDMTIYKGTAVSLTSSVDPSGGGSWLSYDWEYQVNCTDPWISAGIDSLEYNIPAGEIIETRCYRRVAVNDCGTIYSDTVTITASAIPPVMEAGPGDTICSGASYKIAGASVANVSSLLWTTSGDGMYDNDADTLPEYTPGPLDMSNGKVTLYLTGYGLIPPFAATVDSFELTVSSLNAAVNANSEFIISASTKIELSVIIGKRSSLDDLSLFLRSPAGQLVAMKSIETLVPCNNGDSINVTFSTEKTIADSLKICDSGDTITGTYAATGDWSKLYGEDPFNGIWQFEVYDCNNGMFNTDGVIDYVSLYFTDTNSVGDTVALRYKKDSLGLSINQSLVPLTCLPTTYTFAAGARTKCNSSCDADIQVTLNGAIGVPVYVWNDTSFGDTNRVYNLCSGSYTVTVIDMAGCSTSASINVISPNPIMIDSIIYVDSLFTMGDSTAFNLYVKNGEPPLVFTINASPVIHNVSDTIYLKADTFNIHIEDIDKCSFKDTIIIIREPDSILVSFNVDTLCLGDSTGVITAFPMGGVTPYMFILYNDTNVIDTVYDPISASFDSLVTGIMYTLVVIDTVNHMSVYDSVHIIPLSPPIIFDSVVTTADRHKPISTGTFTVYAHGGKGSLQYKITSADSAYSQQLSNTFTGVKYGTYYVTAIDSNLCSNDTVGVVVVDSTMKVSVTSQSPLCYGEPDGSILLTVTADAVPPYKVSIDSGLTIIPVIVGNSQQFNTLTGDSTYYLYVEDSIKQFQIIPFYLTQPDSIGVTINAYDTARCEHIITDTVETGKLDVSITGGISPYTYYWKYESAMLPDTGLYLDTLPSGYYQLFVTDMNKCIDSTSLYVGYVDTIEVSAASIYPQYCYNEEFTLNGVIEKGSYTEIAWLDINGNVITNDYYYTDTLRTNGRYVFRARNANNACEDRDTVTLGVLPHFGLRLEDDFEMEANNSRFITSYIIDSVIPYGIFEWTSTTGNRYLLDLNNPYDPLPIFTAPAWDVDLVEFILTARLSGFLFECTESDTVKITIRNRCMPSGFTPNNKDGVNDYWQICPEYMGNSYVEIFNRWGQLVFKSANYDKPWDGTRNGKPVPMGTYYYILKYYPKNEVYNGTITILR